MRNPNNYGSIIKLSGKRRKPFMAKITAGYDELGRQIQKPIGYFESRKDAVNALAIYNLKKTEGITDETGMPTNALKGLKEQVMRGQPTLRELFDEVHKNYYSTKSKSVQQNSKIWFEKLNILTEKKIAEINIRETQEVFDLMKLSNNDGTIIHVKSIFSKVLKEAIRKGYIAPQDDFSRYIDISTGTSKTISKHHPFSLEELATLLHNSPTSDLIMVYILLGVRTSEIIGADKIEYHLEDKYPHIKLKGSKTQSGLNRTIPIHPYIMDKLSIIDNLQSYYYAVANFNKILKSLDIENHTMYDTRHTFASLAKHFEVSDYYRKKIMGHKTNDLTDDVYTTAYLSKLYNEIIKIDINKL